MTQLLDHCDCLLSLRRNSACSQVSRERNDTTGIGSDVRNDSTAKRLRTFNLDRASFFESASLILIPLITTEKAYDVRS